MSGDAVRSLLWQSLAWGALPLWVAAGFIDWLRHRHSRIALTSGTPEAAMHVAGYLLAAVPVLLGLYCEIDALVLVTMTVCVLVHLGLAWIDTGYTQSRRTIGAVEQAVHPFLELLPVFALVVVAILYADAWRSPEWTLRLRAAPLPRGATLGVTIALVPGFLLTLEELIRCLGIGPKQPIGATPQTRV